MFYEDEGDDGMEMPTPCINCGKIFDLNDGVGSKKWFPNTVICEKCFDKEEEEIERDEEIYDMKLSLANAKWDVNYYTEELKKLGLTDEEISKAIN